MTAWSPINREILLTLFQRFPRVKWRVLYAEWSAGYIGYTSKNRDRHVNLKKKHFQEEDILIPEFAKYQEVYNATRDC